MSLLFTPLTIRNVTFRNRIFVSPMCQYSSHDGFANDWHLVHLGSRAVGGAALVMQEATSVSPEGRISPADVGIWSDEHVRVLSRIVAFVKAQGAVAGLQLAHAGRKASTSPPWEGGAAVPPEAGGWQPIAPSPLPFDSRHPAPAQMSVEDMDRVCDQFIAAARRGAEAGYQVLEIHAAHGYLLHEFLSPLSNRREDEYGGSLQNRMRFPLQVAEAVREVWPQTLPVFVRISASDYLAGGWDQAQSIAFARELGQRGVDLVDCSSGGLVPESKAAVGPGFQVPFAAAIRQGAGVPTAAVGLITDPVQAETILATHQADVVMLAREMLRDPYWPLRAARKLGAHIQWPRQYERAR
jgi:2,4-dienoyl-CoA reductase-like NADH-dependent reductase (Old Yellow Enzyme family)